MNQMSIFDFIDPSSCLTPEEKIFEDVLNSGSNVENSLIRIKDHINLPMSEFVVFLKEEFGVGGSSWKGYHTWWDGKGLQVGIEWGKMRTYSWENVAKAFKSKYGME